MAGAVGRMPAQRERGATRSWCHPARYFNSAGSAGSSSRSHELAAAPLAPSHTYSAAPELEQAENPGAGAREQGLILGSCETTKNRSKEGKTARAAHFLQPPRAVKKPLTFQLPAHSRNCIYF